ncbi:type VI secretion system baseplate subunit TssE [Azoarcus sp. TTM-91]|uniref:type VI secretion system baseplate subunit TssE n=1 Tax=Azoarcus sp. TTM-91 TaxID=2691581 RepID=UPI00145DB7FB|nr:type VI secretion system baseplate subunit TssE [Azoarcus sp. TTM-91]NMG36004.1 type VI secretion system baseplate subunit TssE [Azoarcus sp. TTM-91]
MVDLQPLDRLQPALLDRLRDDAPDKRSESGEQRVLNRAQLREAVLRDLSWLLNSLRPPARDGLAAWPEAENSVLNYGMPCFSGETASSLDVTDLERAIHDALLRFESRIVPGSLQVTADQPDNVLDWHNVIAVRISALIWAQPVPLELMLRTQLDLESGLVEVRDLGSNG